MVIFAALQGYEFDWNPTTQNAVTDDGKVVPIEKAMGLLTADVREAGRIGHNG
jgi:hypothetical protein